MASESPGPRIGLVLGAGGEPGWDLSVGALVELERRTGWDPRRAHAIVGTSVGALIGAYLRNGADPESLCAHVGGAPPSPPASQPLGSAQRDTVSPLTAAPVALRRRAGRIVAPLLARRGRASNAELAHHLAKRAGDAWTDEHLAVVSWALEGRSRVDHRGGPQNLGQAVRASCAVPGAIEPVVLDDGRRHVDGGVESMTNADLLPPVDLVVALVPLGLAGRTGPRPGLIMRTLTSWTLRHELDPRVPTLIVEPDRSVVEGIRQRPRPERVAQGAELMGRALAVEGVVSETLVSCGGGSSRR